MKPLTWPHFALGILLSLSIPQRWQAAAADSQPPFLESELIFPLEHWHNHASCIVEAPNGDLLVCWFHGSGERTADDVKIEGARKRKGETRWSARFTLADTPGYPDTNCAMFFDPSGRLWLLWPTILANEWHTALMKYRIATDYSSDGPPKWEVSEVLHVTPGNEFAETVSKYADAAEATLRDSSYPDDAKQRFQTRLAELRKKAADKLYRRLGWMTRAHPFILDGTRLIVPLYSDGFSFSLMAITDDWGKNWHTSTPLVGAGNIQPSIVRRKNGSLFTLMRDNGPPPKRLHQSESHDRGETWSRVTDSELPNPGSGAEITSLRNGHWLLISNDTERGRNSLLVQISDDEGKTWKWKRHLELDAPGAEASQYHYPSILQAKDGTLHASYSFHLNRKDVGKDADGLPARKTIKHAHFNEAWVQQGDAP
ncbi:MAG: neuraminidase (sialidase)-like protein [Verrucomicrobia bacterium]|nr:neuraminidase (sialidase)-like protein [Verrucomicrobiota bacterium]